MHHKVTNANTSQENEVTEWLNRTILEMTRTMLFESKLPKSFWTFAVNYTQEILNRLPSQVLSDKTTFYQAFYLKKPSVAYLQIFEYQAYVHVPDDKQEKLDAKAVEGHFVSLPQNRKGYIVSNSQNPLRVYVSHHVTFVETPEISGHVMIQVDRQVPKTEKASINNVDAKLEDKSEIEDLVVEGDNTRQESETRGTMKMTEENIPTQLCQSTRIKCKGTISRALLSKF